MNYVIVKETENGLSITYPCAPLLDGETEQQYLTRIAEKDVGGEYYFVLKSDLPYDDYFRNAWEKNGSDVSVDMEKAKSIHMGVIRKARDAALKLLDIETLKGNDVQAQKQVLRDIPQTFDLSTANTPEELKALWPNNLQK